MFSSAAVGLSVTEGVEVDSSDVSDAVLMPFWHGLVLSAHWQWMPPEL
jgi:hypothetical protein